MMPEQERSALVEQLFFAPSPEAAFEIIDKLHLTPAQVDALVGLFATVASLKEKYSGSASDSIVETLKLAAAAGDATAASSLAFILGGSQQ
jgi:hypothetical protein